MLCYAVRMRCRTALPSHAAHTDMPLCAARCAVLCRYGVKSHLVPHCHYLKSLGISEQELPQLIMSRPQVLVRIDTHTHTLSSSG
jgi:hypothetical protein